MSDLSGREKATADALSAAPSASRGILDPVAVLRALQDWIKAQGTEFANQYYAPSEREASDAIDAVLSRLAEAERERAEWKRVAHVEADGLRCAFKDRADAAEAQVRRLTEALPTAFCDAYLARSAQDAIDAGFKRLGLAGEPQKEVERG
jgi:hypothetical protein